MAGWSSQSTGASTGEQLDSRTPMVLSSARSSVRMRLCFLRVCPGRPVGSSESRSNSSRRRRKDCHWSQKLGPLRCHPGCRLGMWTRARRCRLGQSLPAGRRLRSCKARCRSRFQTNCWTWMPARRPCCPRRSTPTKEWRYCSDRETWSTRVLNLSGRT